MANLHQIDANRLFLAEKWPIWYLGSYKEIAILLGDNLYFGEAKGIRRDEAMGLNGGYIVTDDPQFVEDIAKQYTMIAFPEKAYAFVMDLTGTYKAIEMARKCNSEN